MVLRRVGAPQISGSSASQGLIDAEAERFLPAELEFSDYTALGQLLKNASLVNGDATFEGGWAQLQFVDAKSTTGNKAGERLVQK